jgi:hypothetical protein
MNKLSPVLLYACQQSISAPPTGNQWSETLAISIHLFSEAFASGWYREQFGKDSKSFLVLLGIVMHARPLCGPDLALLIRLGLATPADEHRLYARITDSGLADEIGFHRDTVARCAQQLADRGLIHIGLLPDGYGFRDSRGSFAGTKLYLVAGEVEKCLHKQLHHRESAPASRAEKFGRPAENFRTNIESLKESVVVNGGDTAGDSLHQIFSAFALRKCLPSYSPTPKERAAADQLLADGFQLDSDILPGIARAFDDAPRPVRYFTYCAHVIRESRKRAAPAPRPGSSKPHTTDLPIPPELARAAALYARAAGQCGSDSLIRLGCMAQSCAGAAQAAGASGEDWLADALEEAIGRANPRHVLAYPSRLSRPNWRCFSRPLAGCHCAIRWNW